MNEIYELNFHGNRQEIETEKLRKRELMLHFPKALGTVDETIYVLQDDDKLTQTDYFESKPLAGSLAPASAQPAPKPNFLGIGEQKNERPKTDVSLQTTALVLTNFGNNEKTLGFGNGKGVAAFLSPQKETNEAKVPKSSFDFDSNVNTEENNPFNTKTHSLGLGAVAGSKPRKTTARNDWYW